MTAALSKLRGIGYQIGLEGAEIVCRWQGSEPPDREAVAPLFAELVGRKVGILEDFEERAGIIEYDGGLSRPEAEALAWKCIVGTDYEEAQAEAA